MYKVSYISDGVTTQYTFTFPFFQNADIHVALDGTDIDDSQYSVTPNGDFSGGTVTLLSAPGVSVQIDIYRRVSLSRVIDYQPTAKIFPEDLNTDFNFLLAALSDQREVEIDLDEWKNRHDNIVQLIEYTKQVIADKLGGGGVLGLYNNLLSVLSGALPNLVNDYGSVTEEADIELCDDYGVL